MKKADRQKVFDKYGGRCAYCGCELTKGWHVDHFKPIVRDWIKGGCDRPENKCETNYMPSCASCNIMKSSETLEAFRNKIAAFVNSLNQYHTQYKFAKRYKLVTETNIPVVFYFETLNH
jgi:5-methylcytosine-specific restriction endonuclease McrA